MDDDGIILIGKIVGAHGLNGTSKVHSYAESPNIFAPEMEILVKNAEGKIGPRRIRWAKPHARTLLLSFEGVTSRDQAQELVGCEMYVEKSVFPELDEGTYYWFDLIGLAVYTSNNDYLGRLESVLPTGSNDVYIVRNPKGDPKEEIIIPALESVVLDIDLGQKTMIVDLPEGL